MPTALIVDDSRFMRRILRDLLEKNGYQVLAEATNGEEALRAYQQQRPDLVTMDINMPDVTGLEAVRRILEEDPTAVVVMVTSVGTQDKVMEMIEAGARSYIVKPFSEDSLVSVLRSALEEESER